MFTGPPVELENQLVLCLPSEPSLALKERISSLEPAISRRGSSSSWSQTRAATTSISGGVMFRLSAGDDSIGVKCAVVVGGMDMVSQAIILAKKLHIIVATPGRLVDHLENTKGFDYKES